MTLPANQHVRDLGNGWALVVQFGHASVIFSSQVRERMRRIWATVDNFDTDWPDDHPEIRAALERARAEYRREYR